MLYKDTYNYNNDYYWRYLTYRVKKSKNHVMYFTKTYFEKLRQNLDFFFIWVSSQDIVHLPIFFLGMAGEDMMQQM